jgi:predicted permease
MLARSPGFSTAVILSLALGIGANTAIFTLLDAVLWRILPVKNPEELMVAGRSRGPNFETGFTYQQFRLMRDSHAGADLAAYSPARLNLSIDRSLEPTSDGQMVSGNYFSLLGVNPSAGRVIGPEDDLVPNAHPVAVLSYGYWKRRFAADPAVVGRSISISGAPFTVIGVTPPEFFGVEVGTAPDVFVPLMMQPTVEPAFENLLENPIIHRTWCSLVARLSPGVDPRQAGAVLTSLFRAETPPGLAREIVTLKPASTGLSALREQFSRPLFVLMAIVGVVLLIACANTANLLLARGAARRPELATRLALGATRGNLIRQLLSESLLLSAAGGVCGIVLAQAGTHLLVAYMSAGKTSIALDLNPDLRVLGFTIGVSILTGLLFGFVPALRATRIDGRIATSTLKLDRMLAVAQVALSLLLLVGAGLFIRSLQNLSGGEASRQQVAVIRVEPKGSDQRNIPGTSARLDGIYRDLIDRVAQIPGVISASMSQFSPSISAATAAMPATTSSGEQIRVPGFMVYPKFFSTAGIDFAAGRDLDSGDLGEHATPVCIVNQAYARRIFPGENPLGKTCFTYRGKPYTIVGVVKDSRYMNPRGAVGPAIYTPFLLTPTGRGQMTLYARLAANSGDAMVRIREAVWSVDKTLPQFEVRTLADEMDSALIQDRLIATLSGLFSVLALLLACVGLHGLLAYGVVQRTREIGIRMALGAGRPDILWLILRDALILALAGAALGVPLALAASRGVSGLLFGLKATDPVTIAAAAAMLLTVAVLAGYYPARRASRLQPMSALRNE